MAMRTLTADGQIRLAEIAQRHGVSPDAAQSMLVSISNGGGTMAQFSHPEFGGSGQWMRGGMTMVGDLFNNGLKATVDNLCNDLSHLLLNPPPGTWQEVAPSSSSSSPSSWQQGGMGMGIGGGNWWPADLGVPNASGAQNDLRYAYFGDARRLAVEVAGVLTVYDTADHWISGVSQQQGNGWTLTFTSQYGTVPVSSLRVVGGDGHVAVSSPASVSPPPSELQPAAQPMAGGFAETAWLFGPDDTDGVTFTLAADGSITGGDARVRYWSDEGGALTFYDADGRSTARFDIPVSGAADAVLRGHDPSDPGRTYTLRSPAHREEPAAPVTDTPNLPVDVTTGGWTLEDFGGNQLSVLRLLPDGRIEGGRATEAQWRIKDHGLVFLHGSGRPTFRFDTFQFRAGRWTLIGTPPNDPSASFFLKQS